jgi:transporter family-2 protein
VLFVVAFACCAVVVLVTGTGALSRLALAPRHLFLGGVLVAFYVLSITYIAPRFGIGNAVFFVLLGQLLSAAIIDHFGLFGARVSPLSATRALGIAVMAAGVFITQKV